MKPWVALKTRGPLSGCVLAGSLLRAETVSLSANPALPTVTPPYRLLHRGHKMTMHIYANLGASSAPYPGSPNFGSKIGRVFHGCCFGLNCVPLPDSYTDVWPPTPSAGECLVLRSLLMEPAKMSSSGCTSNPTQLVSPQEQGHLEAATIAGGRQRQGEDGQLQPRRVAWGSHPG